MIALFVGLIAAGLVSAFLRDSALYLLVATVVFFVWLLWRRRASHTDFTLRFGVATFIVALIFVVMQPYLNLG